MKALFEINNLFKTFIDIAHPTPIFYFAILETGPEPIFCSYDLEFPEYKKTKKMVFERYALDSFTINNKCEEVMKYRFSHFED